MSEFRLLRNRLFVNREMQGRMLCRLTVYWVGYHAILWHALFLAEWMGQQIGAIPSGESVPILHSYAVFIGSRYLLPLVALAMFPLVLWDMLKMSHRIAGPLVQLRNRLHDMTNGCPPQKVQFRHGDLLTEIQNAFNAYVDSVSEPDFPGDTHAQAEEQYARLIQQVKALQEAIKPSKKDAETVPELESGDVPATV